MASSSFAGRSTTSSAPPRATASSVATSARSRRGASSAAPTRPPAAASGQGGVQQDLDAAQRVRDGAPVLRLLGRLPERALVEPVDLAPDRELHRGDAEAFVGLVERRDRVRL